MRLHLTRRASYGIRAMVALSEARTGRPLSARRIAADQAIPAAFLPQVMTDLLRAGLVTSTTGRSGGYRLGRPARAISVLDVIRAVDDTDPGGDCVMRNAACLADGPCPAHDLMAAARDALVDRLRGFSLADLAAG
jgi:Rrf2 family protein